MIQTNPLPAAEEKARRSFSWIGFLLFLVVAIRAYTYRNPNPVVFYPPNPLANTLLLVPILLLMLSDPLFFKRFAGYKYIYFPVQAALIQALGFVRPYQDIWGILYVILCVQAFAYLPRAWALGMSAFFSVTYLATLMLNLGAEVGLALGLPTLTGCTLVVTYELVFKQINANRQESQRMLAELEEATQKLREYAAQVQELAASQERDRLARELNDSVTQTIFSISLMAQSIRVLQEKDPGQVVPQLEKLQELSGGALAQMRSLIQQWRPPAEQTPPKPETADLGL